MPKISPISSKILRKIIEKAGFIHSRTEGDHHVYTKQGVQRPVVIPNYPEIPIFIIKNNLRTAGIDRDEYFKLLESI